jgi:chromosomal replication initiator protein
MSLLGSFWNQFLTKLEEVQDKKSVLYSILKQARPIELTEEKIIIACDSYGIKKFLDPKTGEIEDYIYKNLGRRLAVEFVIAPLQKKRAAPPLLTFEPAVEDLFVKAGLNKKYSFENFAVSSTNQVAYAASQAVVKNPGHAYNPLFLYGGVGVGKTHLAQAVAKKILEDDRDKRVYFCPGDSFTNELIEAIRDKTTPRFRRRYRYLNLLIIDDIQFIAGKTHIQEEFFHTFNSIASAGGQIILTSDRPPTEIKNLEDRLRSRFAGGLIVDIQEPDFELKTAILLIKAKEKNINIDMEAAKVIAERSLDSRALEGTLLSLYAKILGNKDQIDLETVDEYFSKNKDGNKARKINPNDVIKAVCTYYNVKQSHLRGPERNVRIVLPRQIAMYLIRRQVGLKLMETAEYLRRKDHTTVLHAEEKISSLLMKDQNFKKEIDAIIQSLSLST